MQTYRTDLRVGESLSIDSGRVIMTLEEKSGQRARLAFTSTEEVRFDKDVRGRTGATNAARGIRVPG